MTNEKSNTRQALGVFVCEMLPPKARHKITITNDFHNVQTETYHYGLFDNEKAARLIKKYACNQADCHCLTRITTGDYVVGHVCEWNDAWSEWQAY